LGKQIKFRNYLRAEFIIIQLKQSAQMFDSFAKFNVDSLISLSTAIYLSLGIVAYAFYSIIIYPYYLGPLSKLPRGKNVLKHYFSYVYGLATGDASINLKLSQKHGPVVHLVDNMVLINDIEIRKHYMTYKCPKSRYYEVFDFSGPTLFSALKKDFHVNMKKLLLPAFNNKSLAAMEDTIYRVGSESLVQYIDSFLGDNSSHEFDILDLFYSNTLDVISELVFGSNFNATWDKKKGTEFMQTLSKSQFMLFVRSFIPFSKVIKLPMEHLLTPIIMENIHKRKQSSDKYYDILQSMIDAKDPETGAELTNVQIVDQCITLLFAAQDTTANTLNWTLYELLRHPEFYKLVADEIIEKFPNLNEPINSQDAKKELKYLDAAILESTRMHPAGADIIPREVPKEGLKVGEYYIPPKVKLKYSLLFTINLLN
jgi:cytochrome P450